MNYIAPVKVWIDADSCPRAVRQYVLKMAVNLRIAVSFVANRSIPMTQSEAQQLFNMVVCKKEQDAADNVIVENASRFDMVITKDVPLASRLVDKGVCVINDRGTLFNKDNIKDKLNDRDFDLQLAKIGFGGQSAPSYGAKELQAFTECFDREIKHLMMDSSYAAASSSG